MLILHGNWTDGALHIWGESLGRCLNQAPGAKPSDHPFAATSDELLPAVAKLFAMPAGAAFATAGHAAAGTAPQRASASADGEASELSDDASSSSHAARVQPVLHVDSAGVRLPSLEERPLASERLIGLVPAAEGGEIQLREFAVPTVRLSALDAPTLLARLDHERHTGDITPAHSLRYWCEVARFAFDLVADQRFVPTVYRSPDLALRAAWQPWFHDEPARQALGLLLRTMPAVVRATPDDAGGRPWQILDDVLRTWTDALVRDVLRREAFEDAIGGRDPAQDPHVAWLSGLLGAEADISEAPSGRGRSPARRVEVAGRPGRCAAQPQRAPRSLSA
jgi:hypothetical protein